MQGKNFMKSDIQREWRDGEMEKEKERWRDRKRARERRHTSMLT